MCGTFPTEVEASKVYTFNCSVTGNYVKIVTGRNDSDKLIAFAEVEVYAKNFGAFLNEKGVNVHGVSDSSEVNIVYRTKCNGTYSNYIDVTFKPFGILLEKENSTCEDVHQLDQTYYPYML